MALRSVPIRRSGVRTNLLLGGDRELVMLLGLAVAALIAPALNSLLAWVGGLVMWFVGIFLLRLMGKADPQMRDVYLRHHHYRPFYPARSTPFRDNSRSQGRRYRRPGDQR